MKKEYIAPALVAILLLLYYGGMAVLFFSVPLSNWVRILMCIIPLAFAALAVYVFVQRVGEIRSEETNDLDKY